MFTFKLVSMVILFNNGSMRMSGGVEWERKAKVQAEVEWGCIRLVQAAGVSPIIVIVSSEHKFCT